MRHRFIFGLNGLGSLINIVTPFRIGDIFRFFFLARKKLGYTVSGYFVSIERLSDLFIANSVFFALGLFRQDIKFSTINLIGCSIGLIGILFLWNGAKLSASIKGLRSIHDLLTSLRVIFSIREFCLFSISLTGSWVLTGCALLRLSTRNPGILQEWVSLNSNFSDPLSVIQSGYNLLFLTLIIPLIMAFAYSLTIPSSIKLARKVFDDFLKSSTATREITPFLSTYAGSGSELFLATTHYLGSDKVSKYMIRVEINPDKNHNTSIFMLQAKSEYKFPKVYYTKDFINSRCTISEYVMDSQTRNPSKNAFESMLQGDDSFEILKQVVDSISGFHISETPRYDKGIAKQLGADMRARILRANAFAFLSLNHFRLNDQEKYSKFRKLSYSLVDEIDQIQHRLTIGACHGDASLTNFLLQELDGCHQIRSIDPNVRFQISNIEYDLAKVMQSTHAVYEFLLLDKNSFPKIKSEFMKFQANVGWSLHLESLLLDSNRFKALDFELLRFFLLFHLVRIIPYKVHSDVIELNQILDLISWVDEYVDF